MLTKNCQCYLRTCKETNYIINCLLKIVCNDISLRLFTSGSFNSMLGRISAALITLRPPEKLVLEVSASGGYSSIVWTRDGNTLGTSSAPALLSEFTHFFEIFVREPTTASDLGNYEIAYSGAGGLGTTIIVIAVGTYMHISYIFTFNRTKIQSE